jgi:hypothetical protein
MDGGYLLLRTKRKVRAEVALLLLGYNIKRAKSALGFEQMMEMLEEYSRRFPVSVLFSAVASFPRQILLKATEIIVRFINSSVMAWQPTRC